MRRLESQGSSQELRFGAGGDSRNMGSFDLFGWRLTSLKMTEWGGWRLTSLKMTEWGGDPGSGETAAAKNAAAGPLDFARGRLMGAPAPT